MQADISLTRPAMTECAVSHSKVVRPLRPPAMSLGVLNLALTFTECKTLMFYRSECQGNDQ